MTYNKRQEGIGLKKSTVVLNQKNQIFLLSKIAHLVIFFITNESPV